MMWAIRHLRTPLHDAAVVTLVLLSEFLVPIDFVPIVARWAHVPARIIATSWWQGLVVPHHAWGMLILSVWLAVLCATIHLRKGIGHQMFGVDSDRGHHQAGHFGAWAKLGHHQ